MKKRILTATLVFALTLAVGALPVYALLAEETDAVGGATQRASSPAQTGTGEKAAAQKTFTTQTLAAYNGKDGKKAYIAVNGRVYDVSALFQDGEHHGAQAGQDLTAAFAEQHSSARLRDFPVVGVMQVSASQSESALTAQEQKRLTELRRAEQVLEQKEAALEESYRSGAIARRDYKAQKAALEAQEEEIERQLDAWEEASEADAAPGQHSEPDEDHIDRRDSDELHDSRDED